MSCCVKLIGILSKAHAQQPHFNKAIALHTETSYRTFFIGIDNSVRSINTNTLLSAQP